MAVHLLYRGILIYVSDRLKNGNLAFHFSRALPVGRGDEAPTNFTGHCGSNLFYFFMLLLHFLVSDHRLVSFRPVSCKRSHIPGPHATFTSRPSSPTRSSPWPRRRA